MLNIPAIHPVDSPPPPLVLRDCLQYEILDGLWLMGGENVHQVTSSSRNQADAWSYVGE